jgi:proteasome lid subunit RPN8/RPN11
MPGIAEAIRRHGVETYPNECCGALIGSDGVVRHVAPLPNTTEEGARRRFLIRPTDYTFVEREATRLNQELLGFYHSHPDHPAKPSQYDLDHAFPFFWYVIVSVQQARPRSSARQCSRTRSGAGQWGPGREKRFLWPTRF